VSFRSDNVEKFAHVLEASFGVSAERREANENMLF